MQLNNKTTPLRHSGWQAYKVERMGFVFSDHVQNKIAKRCMPLFVFTCKNALIIIDCHKVALLTNK